MAEVPVSLVLNLLIFLFVPFIFGYIAKKINISPIIGYIFGGLLLGNLFSGVISKEIINHYAYFGIIFLLFTVGLDINFSHLFALRKYILLGGLLQVFLTTLFVSIFGLLFHFTIVQSLLISFATISSSTTLVSKIIQDKGENNTFAGEIALGILMFQDIAFIPLLIICSSITNQTTSFLNVSLEIILSLVKSIVIIIFLWYGGRALIPSLFHRIAKTSRELLDIFVVIFIFFVTYLSSFLHIPILIGVFIAGILVGQTLEHYHIFSEVRPLRNLLAVVFFVYIGTHIVFTSVFPLIPSILLFSIGLICIKAFVLLLLFLFMRFHSRTSFVLSSYLFQVSESAFILLSIMHANNMIAEYQYLTVISSVLISLILTPVIIKNKDNMYLYIRRFSKKYLPFLDVYISHTLDRDPSPIDTLPLKNHIVLCGYGRIGNYIGKTLLAENIPFIAIDYNIQTVERAKKDGINIIYGDPTDIDILDYAQVDEAIILISVIPGRDVQESIILNAKKLNPNIFIMSRVHRKDDQKRMKDFGVDLLVQPEFEASISIIRKILYWYHFSRDQIVERIKILKVEHGLG